MYGKEYHDARNGRPGGAVYDEDRSPYEWYPNGRGSLCNYRDEPATYLSVPTDSEARKGLPLATGVLDYFPDALLDVARLSKIGNDKHNPGQPLHWSREKSNDHRDTMLRHTLESRRIDTDGVLHATKAAWRALAELQLAIEELRARGVSYP